MCILTRLRTSRDTHWTYRKGWKDGEGEGGSGAWTEAGRGNLTEQFVTNQGGPVTTEGLEQQEQPTIPAIPAV